MDWEIAKPLLEAKLDPKNVVKPSGNFGPKGDYIEGWHAIAEANRIFGHGGWSYVIDMRQDDLREGKNSKGELQWQAAYTCTATVTVGDVIRQDVGFGSGFAKGIGDAIEGATKEAATDALKRALRTFGNPFGLALYDKSRENVGTPKPTQEKVNDAQGVEDINSLIVEVKALNNPQASQHLHSKATELGLYFDKAAEAYRVAA